MYVGDLCQDRHVVSPFFSSHVIKGILQRICQQLFVNTPFKGAANDSV